jgi:hypothetical protein
MAMKATITKSSNIADLRSELERKRREVVDLQLQTMSRTDWSNLNVIRWQLEDLDNDLYVSQFIDNNDKIQKLVGEIAAATLEAQKIADAIDAAVKAVKDARKALKKTSRIFTDTKRFLNETEAILAALKP